jgi:hypothetical protein
MQISTVPSAVRRRHTQRLTATEWRTLLRLLEHFDALPTSGAREQWLRRLILDNPLTGALLTWLIETRAHAATTQFLNHRLTGPDVVRPQPRGAGD